MDVYILASGSKGNMTYLKVGDEKIFIDAGISFSKIKQKMSDYHENLYDVKTILITHEHHDHTYGLKQLLKNGSIEDVYLTKGTYNALSTDVVSLMVNVHFVDLDSQFFIHDIEIETFMLSHDAAEPVGYIVKYDDKKLVVLTDSGYVDQSYHDLLSNADLYILEANHHPNKLMQSARPFLLKKRILSEKGHLSNDDACWLMNLFIKEKQSIWVVAHISEDCNTILDIEESIVKHFDDPTKIEVYYASQEGLPVIKI
ncbi:MAG: MBL fold metallo-hydrolase [Acholeplasmataceae bacterium]|jgi:phosphoribosyl 1,2-cyclic phosphodiesterase|nr:MBL fold metallo-hydrolase [Acholeplasmataceae bacterium]